MFKNVSHLKDESRFRSDILIFRVFGVFRGLNFRIQVKEKSEREQAKVEGVANAFSELLADVASAVLSRHKATALNDAPCSPGDRRRCI